MRFLNWIVFTKGPCKQVRLYQIWYLDYTRLIDLKTELYIQRNKSKKNQELSEKSGNLLNPIPQLV